MGFGSSGNANKQYEEEKQRLAAERAAKKARTAETRKAEGALNVRRQQRSPTVLTSQLGLGGGQLGVGGNQ